MYGRVGCVGVRSSATKGKEDHQRPKIDLTEFTDSLFGASNLKSAFANVDFDYLRCHFEYKRCTVLKNVNWTKYDLRHNK
jgi:hypothetical protein